MGGPGRFRDLTMHIWPANGGNQITPVCTASNYKATCVCSFACMCHSSATLLPSLSRFLPLLVGPGLQGADGPTGGQLLLRLQVGHLLQ